MPFERGEALPCSAEDSRTTLLKTLLGLTDTTCPLCKAVKVLNRELVNEQVRNMQLLHIQLPCLPPTPQKARDWVKNKDKIAGTP